MKALDAIARELRALSAKVDKLGAARVEPLVYTRREAAKALRVSISQLYRLLAAGRLTALPSGIARAELERFVRTPQTKLKAAAVRGQREFRASEEAANLRAALKRERRPRGVI